jgi:hypothetical protein
VEVNLNITISCDVTLLIYYCKLEMEIVLSSAKSRAKTEKQGAGGADTTDGKCKGSWKGGHCNGKACD